MHHRLSVVAIAATIIGINVFLANADQNNFVFMPAPVAHPFFENNRSDFKFAVDHFGITGEDIALTGVGGYFTMRGPTNGHVTGSLMVGVFGANGDVPGVALPYVDGLTFNTPVLDEEQGKLTGFGVPLALNLETQVIHHRHGGLIVFFGPNMSLASFSLDTPYHADYASGSLEPSVFNRRSLVFLGGAQIGAQASVNLGPFTIAPSYMVMFQGGTASFTFDTGHTGDNEVVGDGPDVEPFLTNAAGVDILIRPWDLSFSGQIQNSNATGTQAATKTTILQLAWRFGRRR